MFSGDVGRFERISSSSSFPPPFTSFFFFSSFYSEKVFLSPGQPSSLLKSFLKYCDSSKCALKHIKDDECYSWHNIYITTLHSVWKMMDTQCEFFVTFCVFSIIWLIFQQNMWMNRGCWLKPCSSLTVLFPLQSDCKCCFVCPYTMLTACSVLWDELPQPAPTLYGRLTCECWVSSELLSGKPI